MQGGGQSLSILTQKATLKSGESRYSINLVVLVSELKKKLNVSFHLRSSGYCGPSVRVMHIFYSFHSPSLFSPKVKLYYLFLAHKFHPDGLCEW